jgi:hypothetical protein
MPIVSLQGINENPTLYASSITRGTDEGKPVKISANKTVALSGDGEDFYGIVESIAEDNAVCVVKTRGIVTVPYSGSAPALGWTQLCANGSGGVKTGSGTNKYYFVLDVDTTNNLVSFDLG